jgi:hypothetical protein
MQQFDAACIQIYSTYHAACGSLQSEWRMHGCSAHMNVLIASYNDGLPLAEA